jgi:hypothetical protein
MASIYAGRYTYRELFNEVGFDFMAKSAATYNQGTPDFRRVKVGGVGFDSLDDEIVIPYTANTITITLDGIEEENFDVLLTPEDEFNRQRSFADAPDAGTPS